MSEEMDGFETVQTMSTTWEPKSTGKKKDNTLKELDQDDAKSWIAGYYLESKEGVGPTGNSTIHTFKIMKFKSGKVMVGDTKHLSGNPAETNEIISIWGTGVLNGRIAEYVTPGQAVKITWKGKKASKRTGNPYHDWEIAINKSIEPLSISGITTVEDDNDEFSDDDTPLEETPNKGIQAPAEKEFDEDFDDVF